MRKCYLPLTKTTHFPCARSCNKDNQRILFSDKSITLNKRLPSTVALGLFVGHLNGESEIWIKIETSVCVGCPTTFKIRVK